ncbi:MAG TPA: hypothetical protein VLL52_21250 [Anaerolineae bacterium]|nr:hypothetical protein [Anaerolineae bacterium]
MFWPKKKVDPDKCRHEYGTWEYQSTDSCRQIRVCQHCGQAGNYGRSNHSWGAWQYVDEHDNSCWQTRFCQRCGQQKAGRGRIQHTWGQWEMVAGSNCRKKRHCQSCSLAETVADHQWGPWTAVAPDSCEQVMVCQQCGQQERQGTTYTRCPQCQYNCLQQYQRTIKPQVVASRRAAIDWEDINASQKEVWYECAHCGAKLAGFYQSS